MVIAESQPCSKALFKLSVALWQNLGGSWRSNQDWQALSKKPSSNSNNPLVLGVSTCYHLGFFMGINHLRQAVSTNGLEGQNWSPVVIKSIGFDPKSRNPRPIYDPSTTHSHLDLPIIYPWRTAIPNTAPLNTGDEPHGHQHWLSNRAVPTMIRPEAIAAIVGYGPKPMDPRDLPWSNHSQG